MAERYTEWLLMKFQRGQYGVVFDKLSQRGRLEMFHLIMGKFLKEVPPEKNLEFMERVGNKVNELSERTEANS